MTLTAGGPRETETQAPDQPTPDRTSVIADLARTLKAKLGDDAVIDDHARLRTYECDGLAQDRKSVV